MRESTKVMQKRFKFPLISRRYRGRGTVMGGVANESEENWFADFLGDLVTASSLIEEKDFYGRA